jgi:putative DNA primase/helicase
MKEYVDLEEARRRRVEGERAKRDATVTDSDGHSSTNQSNGPDDTGAESKLPLFSDEALALRFADRHANALRYVDAWGRWLTWTGTHWRTDDTLQVVYHARVLCRDAAEEDTVEKRAKAVASAETVAAVERLARADHRLSATSEQWDVDPWMMNTPSGTIDLKTGRSRSHRPSDYLTKATAVAPNGDCRRWLSFLERVTGGDPQLLAFLQRMFGYALTGDTSAHALFFLFGTGANGKSVLLDTVSGIMGDYHRIAPIETFTASNTERHPTELAGLRGARLVTAVETEEGRRWAESRIKALTGGDKIAARFMRQDFFEFTPQFKLVIAGNHKPGLRSVDEAIRRRFNLVPFNVTIPAEERDPKLREKLKAEWPGILRWLIDGCLAWQRQGLSPPAVVRDATSAYLDAEDALSTWIEECCNRDIDAWTTSTELFGSWKAWAESNGEFVGSPKRFAQNLEARSFQPVRKMRGRGFQGLSINRSAGTPPHASA